MMDLGRKKAIIVIDYFTRKVFGQIVDSKHADKVLSFLKMVYEQVPFEILQSDGGKKFDNTIVKDWTDKYGIINETTIPHYHSANGRVERAIRTLRESLKRTKGSYKQKFNKIINNYNNLYHRGINMTPNQALLKGN
ncbi:putative LTR Retrotransposon [Pseudoloma neurophilia]|uniref:Putative LTR Retrotransposon n=1 Tax=Pseudoloma neurophilia TaxID=146866 RepID=A0A0R0LVB7_9MICR|nr:putative LTR Retrotransposon [Pseudoloma neurophilia]